MQCLTQQTSSVTSCAWLLERLVRQDCMPRWCNQSCIAARHEGMLITSANPQSRLHLCDCTTLKYIYIAAYSSNTCLMLRAFTHSIQTVHTQSHSVVAATVKYSLDTVHLCTRLAQQVQSIPCAVIELIAQRSDTILLDPQSGFSFKHSQAT